MTARMKQHTELDELIEDIEDMIESDHEALNNVHDKKLLLRSLKELKDVVGMERLKSRMTYQVQFLINMRKDKTLKPKMNNTILYGPPGVGKTSVGKVLSKIWYSLGCLPKYDPTESSRASPEQQGQNASYILIIIIAAGYVYSIVETLIPSVSMKIVFLLFLIGLVAFLIYKLSLNEKRLSGKSRSQSKNEINLESDVIKVVSREDFVAGYVGQTAPKTLKLLEENRGRVLFIDEAYSLCRDERDVFGKECLDTLTKYLSENPDYIVIFAGYKREIERSILKFQPGLIRRCMWILECDPYDSEELYEIFITQANRDGWDVDDKEELKELFKKHSSEFTNFGGDTERILHYSQLFYSRDNLKNKKINRRLNIDQIEKGVKELRSNQIRPKPLSENELLGEF
jgi:SpoVK/Ycf46/Vps4 family AAA+-type ATPase